jgi:predicted NBD/HSP70 family sugar kinase
VSAPPILGIDIGGTKIAAGLVDLATGEVHDRRRVPTDARHGPAAVLATVVELAEAFARASPLEAIGIGICELVDREGHVTSAQTIDWRGVDVPSALAHVAASRIESDVRAGAHAEARFGAGRGARDFLYASVGTGISTSLVIEGVPYPGARGHAIMLGAPVVEDVASGLALASHAGHARAEDVLADPACEPIVEAAAAALGASLAALVNALDPELLVIGGGLGLVDDYRARVERALRPLVWSEVTARLPIVPAQLGADAGIAGAALAAPSVSQPAP